MNADGTERRQITHDYYYNNFYPAWSDGDLIYYESNKDTRYQIFSISIQGSSQKRITHLAERNRRIDE